MESLIRTDVYLNDIQIGIWQILHFEVNGKKGRPTGSSLDIAHSLFTHENDLVREADGEDRLKIRCRCPVEVLNLFSLSARGQQIARQRLDLLESLYELQAG